MLLITGARGQLGTCLEDILGDTARYVDMDELDITNEKAVADFFKSDKYDCVVNCAAYTAVDKAEDEPEIANAVNHIGAGNLAKYGRNIIHLSTDYVFDGLANSLYSETSNCNPQSVYGATKLAGELAVMENAESAAIIRTAWLYSPYGNNFVKTMLKLGSQKDEINVVYDQHGTPTNARDLSDVILKIAPMVNGGFKEIFHYTNEGYVSWYEFAKNIMKLSGLNCNVNPITTAQYPTKAKRPEYSVLDKSKIIKTLGIEIPEWRVSLKECIKELVR
ncbi:MAG: dTDP-4-dehydrorhamnose reductase [Rickettsiales bacterium]|jgi:dTDP-4-dehydrorhamnose reductase|nr:dTDP-4-dehydrorhamnose reductase [Rickettsiales bacterium]